MFNLILYLLSVCVCVCEYLRPLYKHDVKTVLIQVANKASQLLSKK